MNLLDKTRQLNKLLQKTSGRSLHFSEVAELLRDLIMANMYVMSRKGKILGYAVTSPFQTAMLQQMIVKDRRIAADINELFMNLDQTVVFDKDGAETSNAFKESLYPLFAQPHLAVVPIIGGANRLGTLVMSRGGQPLNDDDLILAEYGATIIGMEILHMKEDESETEARSRAVVQVAVGSLSYSELEAVEHIFDELQDKEGLLVASKIADRAGITRSVIVNALRKLESAGVIETRSLGMKGTYIKILNMKLVQELEKARV